MRDTRFSPKRVTRTYRQTIDASPDKVFPLLCPVREAEWLEGWRYSMVYSETGLIEEDAVFCTPGRGEKDTLWVVAKHDPWRQELEFVRFTPGSRVCVLRISVLPKSAKRTYVDISYTYTATAPHGNRFIQSFTEQTFKKAMSYWERSMNQYLKTTSVRGKSADSARSHPRQDAPAGR